MKKAFVGIVSLGLSATLIFTGIKAGSNVFADDEPITTVSVSSTDLEVNTADPKTDGTEQIGKDAAGLFESLLSSDSSNDHSKTVKDETVFVISDANGKTEKIIVSDWLRNNLKNDKLNDISSLSGIINVKGDETFSQNGTDCKWDAKGSDISYQGESKTELPVNVKVRYFLDEKEMTPEEIKGKSGHVAIKFEYENTAKRTVTVNGKEEEMTVPFIVLSGTILDDDRFTDIKASNARLLNDGTRTVVVGAAFPGLQDSLKIDREKFKIPETLEIEADVKDFELGMTLTVVTDEIFGKLSGVDITSLDSISDSMGQLNDAMKQLTDGSGALSDGLGQLLEKSGELGDGIGKLADGSKELKNGLKSADEGAGKLAEGATKLSSGAEQLEAGAGQLSSGLEQLSTGAGALSAGVEQLDAGAVQLDDGIGQLKNGLDMLSANNDTLMNGAMDVFKALLSAAESQLKDAGAEVPALTVDNYAQVLDGVVSTLNKAAEGYKSADPATSAIYAAKAKAVTELKGSLDQYNAFYKGLGTYTQGVAKVADGATLVKAGADALKAGTGELKAGVGQVKDGADQLKTGSDSLKTGLTALKTGSDELKKGMDDLKEGTGKLYNGAETLSGGLDQLNAGVPTLKDGITQLYDGSVKLKDGIIEFNEKGIQKLVEAVEGDLEGLMERVRILGGLAAEYNNYSGISEDMGGQVKFIYRTEEIK